MNDYGSIVEEAVRLARAQEKNPEPVEADLESRDAEAVVVSRNDEGAYVAITLVAHPIEEPSEALLEGLLQVTSRTSFGDQIIGGCLPDRRLTLSAIVPLVHADETEVERRVNQLFTTLRAFSGEETSADIEAAVESTEAATAAQWMRI